MTAALICTMLFSLTAYASEEEVLVVNPDAAQLSAEETQQMVEEASRAFYQNGELKKELESEIEFKKEEVETEDEYDEEREFYVLTHNGVSMSFFMETIGEPDENGDPVDGEPMAGAAFTLTDSNGNNVAASSYTSDANGLITIAYLAAGTYTLTETGTPKGYVGLDKPMKIVITEENQVSISGPDSSLYIISTEKMPEMMATITVKNRTSSLTVKKIDADERTPLEGAYFDLYRQVTDAQGDKRKDYNPMEGYKDLVTDENGILPKVTMNLNPGTYYLTETHAPEEYALLQEDLCFTINQNGTVTIETDAFKSWLSSSTDEAGHVSYTIEIPNGHMKNVRIRKINAGTDDVLQGASFELYRAADYDDDAHVPKDGAKAVISGNTDQEGIMPLGMLPLGDYRLVETEAPAGYNLPEGPVNISVTADAVSAMQAGSPSPVELLDGDIWQVTVWNNPGVELPESGGPGTTLIYLIGSILLLGCGTILVARRRARRTS